MSMYVYFELNSLAVYVYRISGSKPDPFECPLSKKKERKCDILFTHYRLSDWLVIKHVNTRRRDTRTKNTGMSNYLPSMYRE